MYWFILRSVVALALLVTACAEEFHGRPPVEEGIHYPLSMAMDNVHGRLLVVNSNFDLAYESASVVTIDPTTNLFDDSSAFVGSFPGDLVIASAGPDGDQFAYVAVRGDNSLSWFRIRDEQGEMVFDCGDPDPLGGESCSGEYIVTDMLVNPGELDEEEYVIGTDPLALAVIPGREGEPGHLLVGAMASGLVSLFEIAADGEPLFRSQFDAVAGIHSFAVDAENRAIYITTKYYAVVYRLVLEQGEAGLELTIDDVIGIPDPASASDYGRGIAVARDGRYVLVGHRSPSMVVVIDGEIDSTEYNANAVKVVPVGSKPAQIRVLPSGPGGEERAYVTCYGDDAVWVLETDTFSVVDRIEVGYGPYDMAADLTEGVQRAYVSNFLEHTVSVIDLNPESAYYHTQIAEIH